MWMVDPHVLCSQVNLMVKFSGNSIASKLEFVQSFYTVFSYQNSPQQPDELLLYSSTLRCLQQYQVRLSV